MGIKQQTQPVPNQEQQPASPQSPFASPDAEKQVIGKNASGYVWHMSRAQQHRANAARRAARIEEIVRQQADLDAEKALMESERSQEVQLERAETALGHGFGLVLQAFKVDLPPIPPPDQFVAGQGNPAEHAATWNGATVPETGSWNVPPAGHCIRCGKRVWRVPAVEGSKGLTHADSQVLCEPDNPNSPVADLGEVAP
jgi:hypothetical protein